MGAVLPVLVRRILDEGVFCHVASSTRAGPHVTPMVFASAGGRIWVTTSRGSVKARAWQRDPRVAGLIRSENRSVAFAGSVRTYDLLDAQSWGRSIAESPVLALAAARFTRKNARFFAGYAVDAHRVPFAWTPPGRVFAELRPDRTALVQDGRLTSTWGAWGDEVSSLDRFRATRTGTDPLHASPPSVRQDVGMGGQGALALETGHGPVVVPCAWVVDGAAVYAALQAEVVSIAGVASRVPAALEMDRAASWRARSMVGAMIRGQGEVAVRAGLRSGAGSFERISRSAGVDPSAAALVAIRARSLVWWRGWTSGTVDTA